MFMSVEKRPAGSNVRGALRGAPSRARLCLYGALKRGLRRISHVNHCLPHIEEIELS